MRYELGSHFEYDKAIENNKETDLSWLPIIDQAQFTVSGKAAFDLAIKDIQTSQKINNVYMPSYCCQSMLDSFIEAEIEIVFYDVVFEKETGIHYNIDLNQEVDVFIAMSYFGIESFQQETVLKHFKEKDTIIIEDITHRLLNDIAYSKKSDYVIASLRKWFPIATGGYVAKKSSKFNVTPTKKSNHLVKKYFNAMQQKADYLAGKDVSKTSYLNIMSEFEASFDYLDSSYDIDDKSLLIIKKLDINYLKEKRRQNAKVLIKGIKKINEINLLLPDANFEHYTPLFLPIMLEENDRDSLRGFLIQSDIYCPIHWPDTTMSSSQISHNQLSLICDQRYEEIDMTYILDGIHAWTENQIIYKNIRSEII